MQLHDTLPHSPFRIRSCIGEVNRHITPDDVFAAVKNAKSGPVDEGDVGAGTGAHRDNVRALDSINCSVIGN